MHKHTPSHVWGASYSVHKCWGSAEVSELHWWVGSLFADHRRELSGGLNYALLVTVLFYEFSFGLKICYVVELAQPNQWRKPPKEEPHSTYKAWTLDPTITTRLHSHQPPKPPSKFILLVTGLYCACLRQPRAWIRKATRLWVITHTGRTDQTLKSPLLCAEVQFCLESLIKLDRHQRTLRIISSTDCLTPSMLYYRIFILYLRSQTELSRHSVASAAAGTWAITARAWKYGTDFKDINIRTMKICLLCLEIMTIIEKHMWVQEIVK